MIYSQKRQKLDDKSVKCIFIGYSNKFKAYKLYNPMKGRVIVSRDVIFNEGAKWNWKTEEESQKKISIEVAEDSVFPPTSNESIVPENINQGIGLEEGSTPSNHSDIKVV